MTHDELLALAQERWPELDKATVRITTTRYGEIIIQDSDGCFVETIILLGDPPIGYGPKSNILAIERALK